MVAGNVVPENAQHRYDAVVAGEHGQVVEKDVAHVHAEGGLGANEFACHAIADVVEFFLGLRLRIGEENGLEVRPLPQSMQGKVDSFGQGAGGFDSGAAEPGRRPDRTVQVVEAWQAVHVQWRHVPGRLGDEDHAVAVHPEFMGPAVAGGRYVPAVGNAHVGDAGIVWIRTTVAVQIVEHAVAKDVGNG